MILYVGSMPEDLSLVLLTPSASSRPPPFGYPADKSCVFVSRVPALERRRCVSRRSMHSAGTPLALDLDRND